MAKGLGKVARKEKAEKPPRAKKTPAVVESVTDVVESTVKEPEQAVIEPLCSCESSSAVKEVKLVLSDEPMMNKAVEELSEQEAAELLHTLFIRAKGGGEAAELADVVKRVLLK
jgi:hypothetical protein